MTAQELRIGNLFDNNGIVDVITPNEIEALFESEDRIWIKPIPLTEEWLVKFEFEDKGVNGFTHKVEYLFDFDKNLSHCWDGAYTDSPCKYVHQLQNLFFVLTGQELTLNETA
jgi:hypothetical protein